MTYQVGLAWGKSKTTALGSELAMLGGVLATVFGFVLFDSGQPALVALANVGIVATSAVFIIGLLLLRQGASPNASVGFLAFVISVAALTIASVVVDPLSASGGTLAALDIVLIVLGSVAALAGGLFLVTSLGALTTGSGIGRAAGYVFLVGGIFQMVAGGPDAAGIALNSKYLENVTGPFYGLAGLLFTVLGPILLYLAVHRIHRNITSLEKEVKV